MDVVTLTTPLPHPEQTASFSQFVCQRKPRLSPTLTIGYDVALSSSGPRRSSNCPSFVRFKTGQRKKVLFLKLALWWHTRKLLKSVSPLYLASWSIKCVCVLIFSPWQICQNFSNIPKESKDPFHFTWDPKYSFSTYSMFHGEMKTPRRMVCCRASFFLRFYLPWRSALFVKMNIRVRR